MQEAEVVGDFLFPADQQPPGSVDPRVRALDLPAASFAAALLPRDWFAVFRGHMRNVTALPHFVFDRPADVALVEAKMLRLTGRGLGPRNGNAIERRREKLLVMHIGAIHGRRQRHATPVDKHRSLDAQLGAIGRVFPGFFPHPAAIWSSPRPHSATSNRCRVARHTHRAPAATARQTRRATPTLESRRGSRCPTQTGWASPSTGNLSTARTRCRPRRFAWAAAADRLYNCNCKSGVPGRSAPTGPRESGETLTQDRRPFGHLHAN